MIETFARIQRTADSRMPFLITGQTGVGKELAARAVHHYSRRVGPLVCINCGALPDALLESELFGHEQGAFTGAYVAKPGLFEEARKGTIFLDEIGELPMRSQGALLRVLDGHSIVRLGGRMQIPFDARVVAATNADMQDAVASGRFRADLYHRLRGLHVHLPPLRDRPADLRLLATELFDAARDDHSLARVPISPLAMQALEAHDWPGNVRELKYAMMLAAIHCGGEALNVSDLPEDMKLRKETFSRRSGPPHDGAPTSFAVGYTLGDELLAIERKRIVQALDAAGGVQTRAAQLLGMPRRSLVRKLKVHRITKTARDTMTH
ncbi:MAG: sigma-54 dependent transcriptional regulator [Deltaproteobacteria bacterium]|nr:sigma-54 dependent transcriptional regulator [Kofleriaceae bacterium]